ncbi:MAG: ribose 5-phosphate isomerase B [Dehalococcoidales bacterium]|nr:ribose 5-phosphate isomerase B [Dehalococcoidales bacterium]
MHIAIGCDHRGLSFKRLIMKLINDEGHDYKDFGCLTTEAVDYPDIAKNVAEAVAKGDYERGILICNNGIGMSIAANKIKGIRAALCYSALNARQCRQHNDANVLCLGASKEQEQDSIKEIINAFLAGVFMGGRHQKRVDKIKDMER